MRGTIKGSRNWNAIILIIEENEYHFCNDKSGLVYCSTPI